MGLEPMQKRAMWAISLVFAVSGPLVHRLHPTATGVRRRRQASRSLPRSSESSSRANWADSTFRIDMWMRSAGGFRNQSSRDIMRTCPLRGWGRCIIQLGWGSLASKLSRGVSQLPMLYGVRGRDTVHHLPTILLSCGTTHPRQAVPSPLSDSMREPITTKGSPSASQAQLGDSQVSQLLV